MKNYLFNYYEGAFPVNEELDDYDADKDFTINSLRISLTGECNEDCLYCHNEGISKSSKHSIEIENIISTIYSLKEFGLKKVKLTGGEPFLYKKIKQLIYAIKQIGDIDIFITTNGTLIDRRIDEISPSLIKKISISLDTLDEEKYRLLTGKNYYSKVIKGLETLREKNFNIEIDSVLLKSINTNKKDLLKIIDFCSLNNFNLQFIELSEAGNLNVYKKYYAEPINVLKKIGLDFNIDRYNDRKKIKYKGINITLCRSIKDVCLSSNGRCSGLRMLPDGQLTDFNY
ncbi:MAG: radical SAM protein [Candidatus Acididesulfobacter guangdongensis]|uniref:Radical SAM protein n=1 Tax=Acididesulfobacter guangdongensis TaxID=2597225 RepID=A0A519BHU0_ACIG2|nr:MAG: radical SAM protein [Candidatus Acididesulfobacter guangdongensis]